MDNTKDTRIDPASSVRKLLASTIKEFARNSYEEIKNGINVTIGTLEFCSISNVNHAFMLHSDICSKCIDHNMITTDAIIEYHNNLVKNEIIKYYNVDVSMECEEFTTIFVCSWSSQEITL